MTPGEVWGEISTDCRGGKGGQNDGSGILASQGAKKPQQGITPCLQAR